MGVRKLSLLAFVGCVNAALAFAQDATKPLQLPDPGIEAPVDVDGDGESTFGDQYFFNWWLHEGGSLADALESAELKGSVFDLSVFFASPKSQLTPPAGSAGPQGAGPAGAGVGTCVPPADSPNHTRRIPPDRQPTAASFHPRMTQADQRFIVFSSAASNLPGANGQRQIYRFEQSANSTAASVIEQISLTTTGASSPALCDDPSISTNGDRVVFMTTAALDPADTDGGVADIYLRNVTAATTVRLTAPRLTGGGVSRGSGSFGAAISGNGQFVAFTSSSSDLVSDANGTTRDVFRVAINANGAAGAVELVSIAEITLLPSIVQVQSTAPMSTVGDEISTVCPTLPITSPESGCPNPPPTGCGSLPTTLKVGRVISDNGMRIVMHGAPCDWVNCDPNDFNLNLCPDPDRACSCPGGQPPSICSHAIQQVYARDMSLSGTFATALVSKIAKEPPHTPGNDGCWPANGCCRRASISADGRFVAFSTTATNFKDDASCGGGQCCDTECFEDVYLVDIDPLFGANGTCPDDPQKVSVVACTTASSGHSVQPILSPNGTFIAFASNASNLLTCGVDTNAIRDIFVRKVTVPTSTVRRSVDSGGGQSCGPGIPIGQNCLGGNSGNPDISSDGMVAVFESLAINLLGIGGDTNGVQDIFQNLSPQGAFIRGDVDLNGALQITDSIRIFNWLSSNGPPPGCYDSADFNDNGIIDITDGQNLNAFLFQGGPPPPCPFCCSATASCCGKDPTGDGLPCGVSLPSCTAFAADGSCSL